VLNSEGKEKNGGVRVWGLSPGVFDPLKCPASHPIEIDGWQLLDSKMA
jgi:hypothetical protein